MRVSRGPRTAEPLSFSKLCSEKADGGNVQGSHDEAPVEELIADFAGGLRDKAAVEAGRKIA